MTVTVQPVGWQFYVKVDGEIWSTCDEQKEANEIARQLRAELKGTK